MFPEHFPVVEVLLQPLVTRDGFTLSLEQQLPKIYDKNKHLLIHLLHHGDMKADWIQARLILVGHFFPRDSKKC